MYGGSKERILEELKKNPKDNSLNIQGQAQVEMNRVDKSDSPASLPDNILELLTISKFDFNYPYKPPSDAALKVWASDKPCFALDFGQVGTITGHEGTRKTTLLASIISAGLSGKEVLNFTLDLKGRKILFLDTEQSKGRFGWLLKSILSNAGITYNHPQFDAYMLSPFDDPQQKLSILRYLVEKDKDEIGIIIVDGSAQMVSNVNSEEECGKLMTLYKSLAIKNDIMIIHVVHLTKEGTYPTGWLGTFTKNMSELTIRVVLDKDSDKDTEDSIVMADKVRGHFKFSRFTFNQDESGKPFLTDYKGDAIKDQVVIIKSPDRDEMEDVPF